MVEKADTRLGALINAQIRMSGPMPVSTYMAMCLTHPEYGYYTTQKPLGAAGDFITAPEISQMFGEMIGIWLTAIHQQMGPVADWQLVELGPGRGTLMQDAMRVISQQVQHPPKLTLVETNPHFRTEQGKRLSSANPEWVSEIAGINGGGPLFVIANEFFDALPVRQFQKSGTAWHEREVGLSGNERAFGLSPTPLPEGAVSPELANASEHEVIEVASAAMQAITALAEIIAKRGGAMLVIDYGYTTHQTGETLQALSRHEFVDPLAMPGQADLTTHVNFEALKESAKSVGCTCHPIITQAEFLHALGIGQRAEKLAKANPADAKSVAEAYHRLTDEAKMGALFKVMAVTHGLPVPYPFGELA